MPAILLLLLLSAISATARPNLIVIMADDMGYGDASCYGGSIPTPHLDRMAAQGMRFTDFHSSGHVCSPTRAGLLTGRYQQRAGIPGVINADPKINAHHFGLDPEREITFARLLKKDGYATAAIGKWHLGYTPKFNPTHHGFDTFRGFVSGNIDYQSHYDRMGKFDWWNGLEKSQESGYSTHLITRHALNFIEEQKDKPFCLYVAHEAVHAPWQGPNDPAVRGPNKKAGVKWPGRQRAFKEMLIEMDKGVGEILAKVEALGLSEKTFVFFLSDNGPAGGSSGPLRGRKGSHWEGGHRVPAIAWWPGKIPAGTTSDALAISLDLMPTMLAMAGVSVPDKHQLDGIDLTSMITEDKALPARQLFWNGKAMRDGPWKLILGGKGTSANFVGLYHLSEDIGEKDNLAGKHPERVERMRHRLAEWHKEVTKGATPQPDSPQPAKGVGP